VCTITQNGVTNAVVAVAREHEADPMTGVLDQERSCR
jgi:hypothetical protein